MSYQSPSLPLWSPTSLPTVATLVSLLVVLALDVRMIAYCLSDLSRRQIVNVFDKQIWTAVVILGGPIGMAAYWVYGRGPN